MTQKKSVMEKFTKLVLVEIIKSRQNDPEKNRNSES